MSKITAVIFDFNGTLYFDSHLHIEAWKRFLKLHSFPAMTDEQFKEKFLGRNNAEIMEMLHGRPLPADELDALAEEKEAIYRDICRERPDELKLVAGAEAFFDALKANGIPFTIATGSGRSNVDFYFDVFRLDRWFDYSRVVYDDGSLPGKPDPAVYLKVTALIGKDPAECMVFEDSFSGIHSAHNAGIGRIAAISLPENIPYVKELGIADIIATDFTDPSVFGLF
ncbi:MAG: HAD family phosphatase [Clostridia bacterium]|nr:HAD family phosphatase [Clostridia bacterium]